MAENHRTPAPRPHPRPRRSDATRAAILRAARDCFASEGYEKATIRAVARAAGIDPAMVMRYYGNKAGLFAAASEFDLRMPELAALPRGEAGAALVGHFVNRWEEDEVLTALLRVAVTHGEGAERIQAIFREQLAPVVERFSPEPEWAHTRAGLVASQILGLALGRYVLGLPPVARLTREEVVAWVAPTVQRYLTGEPPAEVAPPE